MTNLGLKWTACNNSRVKPANESVKKDKINNIIPSLAVIEYKSLLKFITLQTVSHSLTPTQVKIRNYHGLIKTFSIELSGNFGLITSFLSCRLPERSDKGTLITFIRFWKVFLVDNHGNKPP